MKVSTINFLENSPSWSPVDTCGQTERRMDAKKLIGAFCDLFEGA